uniref:Putative glycosyl hydrolase family5 n=1 Tax=uncultured symbiotic protist of Mastotermes darwiniensis TaxID=403661 RepID=A4UX05_9EUKA|nr:putative glycosyl hydrolase family5 [uncultured symbiotic protist of Mastotermes darwiniensis]
MLVLLASFGVAYYISASGNELVDPTGKQLRITGINWFGFETSQSAFHGLWNANLHKVVQQVAEHGFNCFRCPISCDLIHKWMRGDKTPLQWINTEPDANPDMKGISSRGIWDMFMADCKKAGIKVFIDIHGIQPDSYTLPLWGDTEYLISALEWFANEFKNDDTFIAIDVKNEPHQQGQGCGTGANDAVWESSTRSNNWPYVAGLAGKRILAKNPGLLILVEGNQCYKGDSSWWGGNLAGVKDIPVDVGNPKKLVYSPHEYGPSVNDQAWFHPTINYDQLYSQHWHKHWLYIHEEGIAPLLIGEWGGKLSGTNTQWMKLFVNLIAQYGLSHTFWCLNPNSGDTGGLLKDNWKDWDEEKYAFIKPCLGGSLFK